MRLNRYFALSGALSLLGGGLIYAVLMAKEDDKVIAFCDYYTNRRINDIKISKVHNALIIGDYIIEGSLNCVQGEKFCFLSRETSFRVPKVSNEQELTKTDHTLWGNYRWGYNYVSQRLRLSIARKNGSLTSLISCYPIQ